MTRELPEVLNELFRFGSVSEKATEEFKRMKHNADLCPAVTQQLNRLLESYLKYHAVAYDVQGLHDQGTDVLLRYYPNPDSEDEPWRAIAIQIKSYDDLEKSDYVKDLRSQRLQADDEFGEKLVQYVVMLCTSSGDHKDRIRGATKALSTSARPIQALLLELEVRYDAHGQTLLDHAFELLGVAEAWGLEFEAEGSP